MSAFTVSEVTAECYANTREHETQLAALVDGLSRRSVYAVIMQSTATGEVLTRAQMRRRLLVVVEHFEGETCDVCLTQAGIRQCAERVLLMHTGYVA